MTIPVPENEAERLEAVANLAPVTPEHQIELDGTIELISEILDCPMSLITLLHEDLQCFAAKRGVAADSTTREDAFCSHAIMSDEPFVVNDATKDDRFRDNPLVTGEPNIRFYAGCPISIDGQNRLGTLCVMDQTPRTLSPQQLDWLKKAAGIVETILKANEAVRISLQAQHETSIKNQLFEQAGNIADLGAWQLNLDTNQVLWSDHVYRIHGLPVGQHPDLEDALAFYPDYERKRVVACIEHTLATGEPYHFDADFNAADGRKLRVRSTGSLLKDTSGGRILTGVFQDITNQYHAEEELRYVATYDTLTGLINRYTFLNRLNEELAKSPCPLHAVILLDLDNFKSVNDLFGHAAGDFVLKVIAGRLEALAGDRATCARLSGDEFAIILLDDIDIDQFTQSLLGSLRRPIQINLQTILMRGTVGTMLPPFGGITADDALKNADIALYKAKANQKGGNIIYRKEFTTELNLRQKTLQMALDAVDRNGIIPYFQPIHDLASQTVVGAEVLMRIRKPDGKILGPGTFADALADPECATLLDLKILDNVSALLPRLTKGPNPPPYLSINAGSAQLRSAAFVQSLLDIHQRLHKHGSYVALEVVESVLFDDFNAELKNTLIRLSDAGLSIALDDFGTGYASLSHLRDYPIDTIKIDKSFIRDLGVRNDCAAIVRAIVDMGITLEKKVIAEGIETPAQLDYLRQIECPMVQGFLLGRPCPIDAFEEAFVLQQADH